MKWHIQRLDKFPSHPLIATSFHICLLFQDTTPIIAGRQCAAGPNAPSILHVHPVRVDFPDPAWTTMRSKLGNLIRCKRMRTRWAVLYLSLPVWASESNKNNCRTTTTPSILIARVYTLWWFALLLLLSLGRFVRLPYNIRVGGFVRFHLVLSNCYTPATNRAADS